MGLINTNKKVRLLDGLLSNRVVLQGSWKKKEAALSLIRSGYVFNGNTKVTNPFEVVSKGVRYRVSKEAAKVSWKRKSVEGSLGFRYQSSKVSSAFWQRWSDQVVSSRGKDFVYEKGRYHGMAKQKTLSKDSFKTYYRVNNRSIDWMSKSKSCWPRTSGFNHVLYKNMERRLDVALVRLGYALDLREARSLIKNGKVALNRKQEFRAHSLLKAGCVISVIDEHLPFTLLKREHLKHYPVSYRVYSSPKSRLVGKYRRFSESWFRWLSKRSELKPEGDFRLSGSRFKLGGARKRKLSLRKRYMFFKDLRKKLSWSSGSYLKRITKRTFKHPELHLSVNFVYLGLNEVLFTHYHQNKDISLPLVIGGGKF